MSAFGRMTITDPDTTVSWLELQGLFDALEDSQLITVDAIYVMNNSFDGTGTVCELSHFTPPPLGLISVVVVALILLLGTWLQRRGENDV